MKWAAAAVAAVGSAAVVKLSLDHLGTGDGDGALTAWAFVGLAAFAVGAVLIIAAVVWQARASRVTIAYLLKDRHIPRSIHKMLDENTYLLGGAPNLLALRNRLNELILIPRPQRTPEQTIELSRLLDARTTVTTTAGYERVHIISKWATLLLAVGAVVATLGAATFALVTNRDSTLRADRIAETTLTSGELAPKSPSEVTLVVPKAERAGLRRALGAKCNQSNVNATVLEIATPAQRPRPARADDHVFHIVTLRSPTCSVRGLWVPAEWLRPGAAATSGAAATTATSGG